MSELLPYGYILGYLHEQFCIFYPSQTEAHEWLLLVMSLGFIFFKIIVCSWLWVPWIPYGMFIEFSIHVWAFALALGTHAALSYISVGCPGEEASA